MAAAGNPQSLQLKLTVDKTKNRVVYAECDRLMVDVFFSFLTTPVAALVRRTGKASNIGCMDALYQVVEDMPAHCFQTPECREMLLRPRNTSMFAYHRLKLSVNDVEEGIYICPTHICPNYSLFPGAKCECGRNLDTLSHFSLPPERGTYDEVFIDRDAPPYFLVTDDLFISQSTADLKAKLSKDAGVESQADLEERIEALDNQQVVQLLKLSLLSNNPLSVTFLAAELATKPLHWPLQRVQLPQDDQPEIFCWSLMWLAKRLIKLISSLLGPKKMVITVFHDRDRVLYASVDESFIDLLFSFLTLPFGTVAAAFHGNSFLGCIDNLHRSVRRISSDGSFHKLMNIWNAWGHLLYNPPIALHHSSCNELFKIGKKPRALYEIKCKSCDIDGFKYTCKDKEHHHFTREALNPKIKGKQVTKKGGGYMLPQESFVITNALVVKPNYDLRRDIEDAGLIEKKVLIGRKKVFKLLKASLISEDPLTSVFLPKKQLKFLKKKHT